MTEKFDSIVHPIAANKPQNLGSTALLVSVNGDIRQILKLPELATVRQHPFLLGKIYTFPDPTIDFCIVGPVLGSPYAAITIETLACWGIKRFLFLGWCGAVSTQVKIGDLIVVKGAIIDEGTSVHYDAKAGDISRPSEFLQKALVDAVMQSNTRFHQGLIWTTDAVYRETAAAVLSFQKRGVLAVEMEVSSLFSVAAFRNVEIGALIVVSDEVSALKWQQGFSSNVFKSGRDTARKVMVRVCRQMSRS